MRDEEVIEKIKEGNPKAIEYLYKTHYRMMVNVVKTNSGSEDEAKDIYQDALVIFWEKVASGDLVLTSKISTYLYSVVYNLWRKELSRKGKLSYEESDTPEDQDMFRQEKIDAIISCIKQMSDTCQKVLSLYYFEKLSMQEIAEKLDFAGADTAKTKKYKCKKELDSLVLSKYDASDFLD